MQRDLQRAREENAYLRAQLKQQGAAGTGALPSRDSAKKTRAKDDAADADFDRALARRQARLDSAATSSGRLAANLELKSANDRVAQLERQLLDAEETICHLKAEKLAAVRDVERLSAARERRGTSRREDTEEQRRLVLELETRLAEQKQAHALEQEQRMAVIRDQELELKTLRAQLEEKTQQYKELRQRHIDLLELDDQVMVKQSVTSGQSQFSIYGEDSDEDEDAKATKPKKDKTGRARAPADADSIDPKWKEELVRHPTPHFDLESPEVAYILRAWTKNIKKMRYLRRWLIQVVSTKGPLPEDFPMGVELPRLPPEVRDGFLTLILPLLRKQTQREILAHSRLYNDGVHTDLRFRVVPRD
ncbi:hypothetical protein PHYSODRAFT_563377 [Phytophthora sojae]|uniref:Uncharacterized protein n=1 Tax=Phytophthora sojae (strain P6497) TaxID=1094619 RepID=G4ZXX3_PHYSP|nr:hypothetical protein PHYSODRAFT_563377 [Phytophthora sojae]EGZ12633.1 hypothetical protein PHYSODRAFT_563377 [Phytophthora sojae]|eukprot:XP_009532966.1 hypothetical protein PHYSODRAFT_563377 [Phytophthora sojae]